MERILSEGIIYKISKYADNSAIASAYTLDYGKINLWGDAMCRKDNGTFIYMV